MEKRNSQCEHGQPMEQTRSLFCTCNSGVAQWLSITTTVQHLANECSKQIAWEVSLAAVNQILCGS